ncbi:MAG: P-II family nitrogen regulator [Gemmatimonadota bacterium]
MEMLIAVIDEPDHTEEILAGFLELGITGATLIGSEGMGRVLSQDGPVFAGLQSLISRSRPRNQTLFSVIEDPDKVDQAIDLIESVCGRFTSPSTGIVFTVPVNSVVGLATRLEDAGD